VEDHCGSCTRCLDACPTGCLEPYRIDGSRCISYLTIEHREVVADAQQGDAGDWLFGCDVCQEVCPHNSPFGLGRADTTPHEAYAPRRSSIDPVDVVSWDEASRLESCAGTAMTRARLSMYRRNAAYVLGHRRDARGADGLRLLLEQGDDGERAAARWALDRIR
ncbi:MAG: hypothetical protein KDA28_15685, partial [Phycisphaerales bacterium]|nr:hypothetical protein [Phycisphaerales bacterium]